MSSDNIFATLRGSGERVWAVGAIHGEVDRLSELHRALAERFVPGDNLVYLGNYFGHGRKVGETLDELLLFRRKVISHPDVDRSNVVFLRGAQEEMWRKLLQIHLAPNPREVLTWMLDQGVGATITAYGGSPADGLTAADHGAMALNRWTGALRAAMHARDGHSQFMSALRHAAYTENNAILLVHAGIDPSRPLSAQNDSFWWSGQTFTQVTEPYSGFKRVVRGFSRGEKGIVIGRYTASVDAGCGFGGRLLAALFDSEAQLIDTVEA